MPIESSSFDISDEIVSTKRGRIEGVTGGSTAIRRKTQARHVDGSPG